MFKCGLCLKQSEPNEKAFRVVTETRVANYPYRKDANRFKGIDGKSIVTDDPGGTGNEIVKEVLAHSKCAEKRLAT